MFVVAIVRHAGCHHLWRGEINKLLHLYVEDICMSQVIFIKAVVLLIRFERLWGSHIIIICTWVQYQIGTLTFINIVSLSFSKN